MNSCSVSQPETCTKPNWAQQKVLKDQDWQANGKYELITAQKKFKGKFKWSKYNNDTTISLYGPVGLPVAVIQSKQNKTEVLSLQQDISTNINNFFNSNITLQSLNNIIVATPTVANIKKWQNDFPKIAIISDYEIQWHEYDCMQNFSIPRLINITQQNNDNQLKITINSWST